jgi:tRNA(fMet)-specific endonuclease VapC
MKYLLDTNICIYIIKKKPEKVFKKFRSISFGSIGISSITLAELQYGVMKSSNPGKNQEALERFITPLQIFDFGFDQAFVYGKIRAELERKGTPIGPLDTLIASHAVSLDLILVTNNMREFKRIPDLQLENWIE